MAIVASDWSIPIGVQINPIYTWLKVPNNPGMNVNVIVVTADEISSTRKAEVFEPLGRPDRPIVVGLGRAPRRGALSVAALSMEHRLRIASLLESGLTILVQHPPESGSDLGEQWYLEVVDDLTTARAFSLEIDRAVERIITFNWVEVSSPEPLPSGSFS